MNSGDSASSMSFSFFRPRPRPLFFLLFSSFNPLSLSLPPLYFLKHKTARSIRTRMRVGGQKEDYKKSKKQIARFFFAHLLPPPPPFTSSLSLFFTQINEPLFAIFPFISPARAQKRATAGGRESSIVVFIFLLLSSPKQKNGVLFSSLLLHRRHLGLRLAELGEAEAVDLPLLDLVELRVLLFFMFVKKQREREKKKRGRKKLGQKKGKICEEAPKGRSRG